LGGERWQDSECKTEKKQNKKANCFAFLQTTKINEKLIICETVYILFFYCLQEIYTSLYMQTEKKRRIVYYLYLNQK
jgi:hypothetical protein